jgi:UDP-N-acetylglucosamine 2-epimerase (non-hydrolysing)
LIKLLIFFDVKVDFDLDLMQQGQSLADLSSRMLMAFSKVLADLKPDLVLVHGDTSTTFIASLACYYMQIEVGHVEAGLRTGNIYSPWPEEGNRKMTGILAKYHFCPTTASKEKLLKQSFSDDHLYITGNTVIDTLYLTLDIIDKSSE